MPRYPSTISLTDARGYYGPSREDPRSQPRVWSNRPPSGFYEESHPASTMAIASLAVGSVFASGFIKVGDRRLWDYYVSGIRGIEEYSPGGIFRTFQASTFFSQFTSPARQGFSVGGEFLRSQEGRGYARYLSTLIGDQPGIHSRILKEGVTLKGGSLFFGETGDLALKYAGAFISPTSAQITSSSGISTFVAGKHLGSGYARSMGFSTESKFGLAAGDARLFGEVIKAGNAHKIPEQFHRQIIGSHSALGYAGRQFGAAGTELVSHFNRLLEAPFEMQPFKTVFGGAQNVLERLTGKRIQLAVKYGSGSEMLGRLALKYGVAAGALGIGYKSLDYLFRQSEYLNDTFLDEGLTAGLASIWTKANVLVSQAAETTGLHTYREAQEEIAPGSTDLSRLIAFPLIGGLSASGAAYGVHVAKMAKMQYASIKETGHMLDALSAATARVRAQEELTEFGTKGLMGRIGKIFGDKSYPFIGKIGPVKLAGLIGAGIGATLAAPFLPGALIPSTRPDELKRIYSGEQEVAIRKGRWWEFGRTPWEGQRVMYYRPHWYPRMLQRSKETSIWGDKPPTPLEQWWRKEFTYDLEKEFYNERPYPISSLPFEDIPLIGPVLANTIGRLIKPPVLMHTEEWLGSEGEQLAMAPGFGERMATELGQLPPGTAESPFNITGTVGEQAYRLTEMVGLPGFAMTSLKEAITGSPDLFDQSMRLESARRAFGIERSYWDLEIGGGLGTTEALRRLYPHRRRQINLYNPIRNTAPEWLPGPGERAPDFLHGDPYCISSDTLVEALGHGFMRVDKLRESDWIKSHKGRWLPVKKIIRREMNPNEQLFEIKVTSLAAFPIKASEEHPLWTPEGWIEVKDLKEGDYVGYPIPELDDLIVLDDDKLLDLSLYCDLPFNDNHIFVQGSQEYADCVQYIESTQSSFKRGELKLLLEAKGWNRKTFENAQRGVKTNNINRIPRYINPQCAEWGLLSGYYAAEGSSTNGSICFAFNKHEVQYHNEVISSLKYLFNIEGKIYPASQGEGVSLIVTNKALAQIFPRIFGQNSYSKRLPLWVGSFIPALAALFNGDGSFFFDNDKPRLSLSSKSKKLLWEIRQFLLVFGYVGSIVEDNLIYRGQAAKDCAQFISTSKYRECPDSSRTVRHTYIQDGYVWMRIFSKREVPQEPVYGIEVDYDDSFCVVGVATHNTKVQEGELRLPGRGYEARFPELKGLSPEEYPDIHKYKILADVAPYSDKFKLIQQSIRSQRKLDSWSEYEENIWTTTEAQLKERKIKRRFTEYQYLTPTGTLGDKNYYADESKGLLTELNKIKASQQPETGVFARAFGGYWEALAHNAETAMDVLTPISPAAKLIHQRTAIEDYANSQVYGTENAFWSHPMRDFIRPFLTKVGVAMGFDAIPEHIKKRRNLEEYFDILEYTKYTRLSNMARMAGDMDAMKEFESKKNETMFGLNPFTYNFSHIFRALPRRERDYFNAFAAAETVEERAKILNMVPENEKALYIARWKLQLRQDIQEAEKAGLLSEDQIEEADSILTDIDNEARAEGFPNSKELFAEYLSTKLPGENYGDWYRRTQLLPDIPLPGDSWIGWHPSVDLEDVKLKVVQAMGEEMYDYDLWPTRAQALLDKPFINESAVAPLFSPDQLSPREMQDRIQSILLPVGVQAQIFHKTSAELEIDMEQDVDIESFVNRLF